jgi:hypothetical protein
MVKVKVKNGDITQFLHAWDREAYDLNLELKKMLLKQKKGAGFPTEERRAYF